MAAYDYLPLERVIFGRPAAEAAAEEATRIGAQRVFVVASKSLSRKTREISRVQDALGEKFCGLFDDCIAHTPWPSIIAAAEAVRAAQPDLILTVGGGTPIDTVKILQICLAHGVSAIEGLENLRVATRPSPVRQVVVPTTLSGAEFSNIGGGTDPRTRLKHSFSGADVGARSVILDPALTLHTPEWLWLSTGVRAVDHACETLGSLASNDYCDGMAESALRLLAEGLLRVEDDPRDLEARLKCQVGAWQSMISIIGGVPMGASHAIGHILGGTCDVPHGYTSCVMSPYVLEWNAEHDDSRQARILAGLGQAHPTAAKALDAFIRGLGLPRTLSEVGVGEDRFQQVAEYTMLDIWGRTNPRPVTSPADIMEILRRAA